MYVCSKCGVSFERKKHQLYCSRKCASIATSKLRRKVHRPSKEELYKLVWETPCSVLSLTMGVSGTAIKKWCAAYNIDKPPRGYWAKHHCQKNKK